MRCAKCGKFVPLLNKFCQKCGTPVPPGAKKKSWISWMSFYVGIMIILPLAMWGIESSGLASGTKTSIIAGLAIGESIVIFVMLFFAFYGFWQLIKLSFRQPIYALIPLAIIGMVVGIVFIVYLNYEKFSGQQSLIYIQDCLEEAAAAKIAGDIAGANADYGMIEYSGTLAAARIANVSVTNDIGEYKKVSTVWASKVRDAAKDKTSWPSLAAEPAEFTVKIYDTQATEFLQAAAEKISVFKEFGDEAMKQKNKDTFKYIAAKLLVQKHWLNGLLYSKTAGGLGLGAAPALAYSGQARKICYQTKEGKELCAGQLIEAIDVIFGAAKNLAAGKDKANEEWTAAWNSAIKERGLIVPYDVLSEEQAKNKYTPTVQKFVDECYGVGGVFDTNAVNTNYLPTSERGYRCTFKAVTQDCWRLLSYSGEIYYGGDAQCPQNNLLSKDLADLAENIEKPEVKKAAPAPAPAKTTPKKTTTPVVWDGNYYVSGSMSCTSDDPTFPASIPLDPFTVVIKGNKLVNTAGESYALSAAGAVTITKTQPIGTIESTNKISLQFYKEGGVIKVRGTSTADLKGNDAQGVTHTAHCSGPLSGVPQ